MRTLAEAFVGELVKAGKAAEVVPGEDQIRLPLTAAGLVVDVRSNGAYFAHCSDLVSLDAFRQARKSDVADPAAVLDWAGASYCPENEHFQTDGFRSLARAAAAAWDLGEALVGLQALALAAVPAWTPTGNQTT